MVYRSFLSPTQAARIDTAMQRGWVTLQEFYDPDEITTIRRGDGNEWEDVATFTPVRIRFTGTPAVLGTNGQGASEVRSAGDMRVYVPLDITRGDRFIYNGNTCVVGTVEDDDNHGTAVVNFTVLEG